MPSAFADRLQPMGGFNCWPYHRQSLQQGGRDFGGYATTIHRWVSFQAKRNTAKFPVRTEIYQSAIPSGVLPQAELRFASQENEVY
jgi:hypothetical protein